MSALNGEIFKKYFDVIYIPIEFNGLHLAGKSTVVLKKQYRNNLKALPLVVRDIVRKM